MAKRNIMSTSFTMSDEFNLSASKITMKTKQGEALCDLSNEPVVLPVQAAPFLSALLGCMPMMSEPEAVSLSPIEIAAMSAVPTAGKIMVNQITKGFNLGYLPSLFKVTNGSFGTSGVISKQGLMKLILDMIAKQLSVTGPARSSYSQILKEVLESSVQPASLKGNQPNCQYGGDPVNLNTGNYMYEKSDISIMGRGPLEFKRFYNRIDIREGIMGKGWRHNFEIDLFEERFNFTIVWQDGREEVYRKSEDGKLEPLFGNFCRLHHSADGFCYETKEGLVYLFDKRGKLYVQMDLNGEQLKFYYNKQDKLERVTSQNGGCLCYHYQRDGGWLSDVVDQAGRRVSFDYELGRLRQVTNAMGESYSYMYDETKSIQKIKNPRGVFVLNNIYDSQGRTIRQHLANGGVIKFDYQDDESRMIVMDQRGNQVAYMHDEKFRNVETIYTDGMEMFYYNDQNQIICKTDKNGNKTKFSYDDRGNTTHVICPDGAKYNMRYDINNRLLSLSLNGVEKLKNTYDQKGNLIKSSDALSKCWVMHYDQKGNAIRIIQPDHSEVLLEYDSHRNIKNITDGAGNCIAYEYDNCNRTTRVTDGDGNFVIFVYNNCNQITSVINTKGRHRTYEYTKDGKVTKIVDFNGATFCQEYNNMDQVKTITLPDGGRTCLEYDLRQNVIRKALPDGAEITYSYDNLNRLVQMKLPTGGVVQYDYDPNGNRITETDTSGYCTAMEYDELNRVTKITDPSGYAKEYEYDLEGNLVNVINAAGKAHIYRYNAIGQVISETDIVGKTTNYEYCFHNPVHLGDFNGLWSMEDSISEVKEGNYLYNKIFYEDGITEGIVSWEDFMMNNKMLTQKTGIYLDFIRGNLKYRLGTMIDIAIPISM